MRETLEMQPLAQEFLLLEGAEGKIQKTETQDIEVVDELTEDIGAGAFNVETFKLLPCKCIDGRTCIHPTEGPNAAGGTETIFVADDLTTKRYAAADGSVAGSMKRLIEELQKDVKPVGGHSDNKPDKPEDASGCGANDKLPEIYDLMVRKADVIKDYAEKILGFAIDDETEHQLIIGNAKARTSFSSGKEVLETFKDNPGADHEELDGGHKEVVAAINFREGTSLSRELLAQKYGPDYQAFNVDAWSFQHAAEATSETADEVRKKVIAMTYYNVATALVLCGPEMRIVLVK